jgi:hypothetical protein
LVVAAIWPAQRALIATVSFADLARFNLVRIAFGRRTVNCLIVPAFA